MEIVVRPANARFLEEVVFPAFTIGMTDLGGSLTTLAESIIDDRLRMLAETLIEQGIPGGFEEVRDSNIFSELIYRVLFTDWKSSPDGWVVAAEIVPGYAGEYEQALHLSLMVEHPDYPYDDPRWAAAQRELFQKAPDAQYAFSSLICGLWSPRPAFYPEWVLTTVGRADLVEDAELTCGDWSFRSPGQVRMMNANLPAMLDRLLQREADRLPVEVPEAAEIKAYWLGQTPEPPMLAVAFSALGPEAAQWVREIGEIAHLIRGCAKAGRGMTALTTSSSTFRG